MKVTTRIYEVLLEHPFGLAGSVSTKRKVVLCKIEHDGIEGYGEAAPSKYYGESPEAVIKSIEEYARQVSPEDVFYIRDLMKRIVEEGKATGSACAALNMALYDYAGKILNVPLYKMIGLKPRTELMTSYTIGIDTIDVMMKKVEQAKDYPILKIKMGRDVNQDIKVIKEIRKEFNKVIRVDANGGWTLEDAKKSIPVLEELGIEYVEQPLERGEVEKTAELKEWSPLPIFLDEDVHTSNDVVRLSKICHGINLKLMKCGGITEALRMFELARALDLQLMIGCMIETSLAITAGAQVASFCDYLDLDGNLLITNDPFDGVKTVGGNLQLPDRPGLGVIPKEELF